MRFQMSGVVFIFLFCVYFLQFVQAEGEHGFLEVEKSSDMVNTMTFYQKYVTDLSVVIIEFLKPVVGVKAEDLIVNGSPATKVVKEIQNYGDEYYTFSGFALPPLGKVKIELSAGEIISVNKNKPFAGITFTKYLLDPQADEDQDGLTNQKELDHHTSPVDKDTDADGLPDSFEVENECLNPVGDQAHPQGYDGKPLPGDNDADDDGLTDLEEFQRGTDPCH